MSTKQCTKCEGTKFQRATYQGRGITVDCDRCKGTGKDPGTPTEPMSVKDAGRRGGEAVKTKYEGSDYYSKIGQIGGEAVAKARGHEFYAQIGKIGGSTVKQRYGSEFYADIGRKGGEAVKTKHGPDYYSRIGKKGRNKAQDSE